MSAQRLSATRKCYSSGMNSEAGRPNADHRSVRHERMRIRHVHLHAGERTAAFYHHFYTLRYEYGDGAKNVGDVQLDIRAGQGRVAQVQVDRPEYG